jgi:hypothetical protein
MKKDSIVKELTEYERRVNELVNKIIWSELRFKERSGSNSPINETYVPIYHIIESTLYTKILNNSYEIWGFVVKQSDDKFKEGDILRAKSKDEPFRNRARGNIYDEKSLANITWFGAE